MESHIRALLFLILPPTIELGSPPQVSLFLPSTIHRFISLLATLRGHRIALDSSSSSESNSVSKLTTLPAKKPLNSLFNREEYMGRTIFCVNCEKLIVAWSVQFNSVIWFI